MNELSKRLTTSFVLGLIFFFFNYKPNYTNFSIAYYFFSIVL